MELSNYLYHSLCSVPNLHIYGPAPSETVHRAALCSFNVEKIHPTDIATFLDEQVSKFCKLNQCVPFYLFPLQLDVVLWNNGFMFLTYMIWFSYCFFFFD